MPDIGEPLRPRTMDFSFLIGFWEIIDCGLETAKGDSKGVLGAVFELSATGDVSWKLPENPINIPLFNSETYEVVSRGPFLTNLLRFGSYKGHVIEFRIEKYKPELKTMMIHEGLFYMTCKKQDSMNKECIIELPFSLLPALEEGYFTDLSIFASNNREFRVHRCILRLCAPEIDWTADPTPLSGLSPDVIGPILHFLYTQSLPSDLTVRAAEQVVAAASTYPGLEPLISMCQSYVRNVSLTREMVSLISDMHACAVQIIDHFTSRNASVMITDPATICSAVKNSIRDIAVAGSKMLLFCDLYNKRKNEFSRKGGHEIIRFTKSRIPVFVSQMDTFFETVKSTFGGLLASERHELACYLLPEMETIFDTLISILVRARAFFEAVLIRYGAEDEGHYRIKMDNFKDHMDRVHHKKEINKIRFVLQRMDCIVVHLHKKRENFQALNNENQIRSLTRNLEHLIERLPFFLLRLEEVAEDLDQKLEWSESQFCFKVGTSKVDEILQNLLDNKEYLQDLVSALCDLIQRDGFTQSVIALGILDPAMNDIDNLSEQAGANVRREDRAFNLTEFLCEPPPPRNNALSKAAIQLLRDGLDTDMVFEVIGYEESDSDVEETGGGEAVTAGGEDEVETTEGESEVTATEGEGEAAAAGGKDEAAAAEGESEVTATEGEGEAAAAGGKDEAAAAEGESEVTATEGEGEAAAAGRKGGVETIKGEGEAVATEEVEAADIKREGEAAAIEGEGEAATAEGEGEATATEGEGEAATAEGEGEATAIEGEGEAVATEEVEAGAIEGEGEAAAAEEEGEAAAAGEEEGEAAAAAEEEGEAAAAAEEEGEAAAAAEEEGEAAAAAEEGEAAAAAIEGEGEAAAIEGGSEGIMKEKPKKEKIAIRFKAHRAIVAARCSLFKRALLSGMQEDIQRKIDIHNIGPKLFPLFLDYLYTGVLDYSSLSARQIADMLLVADCYELDSFKQSCENALKVYINDDSVMFFLSLADRYNAKILKNACLLYISQHPDVALDCSLFEELQPYLQIQIYDLVIWGRHQAMAARNAAGVPNNEAEPEQAAASANVEEVLEDVSCSVIGSKYPERAEAARPEPEEQLPLDESLRFERAIEQLREIVGPGAPRSVLVQVLLAADYDLNRALNYYYSSS